MAAAAPRGPGAAAPEVPLRAPGGRDAVRRRGTEGGAAELPLPCRAHGPAAAARAGRPPAKLAAGMAARAGDVAARLPLHCRARSPAAVAWARWPHTKLAAGGRGGAPRAGLRGRVGGPLGTPAALAAGRPYIYIYIYIYR